MTTPAQLQLTIALMAKRRRYAMGYGMREHQRLVMFARERRAIGFRNAAKWRQLPARKTQTLPPGLYDAVVASTSWQHDTLLLDILVQQDSVPGEPPIRIRLPTYFTTTPKDIS